MAREAIDVSLRVLKESSKSRFDSYMYSVSVFVIPVLLRLQLQSSTLYLHLHIYSHSSYLLHIYYPIIAIVHNLTDNRKYTIFDQKVFNTLHYKFLHVWCHCYNIFSNYLFLSSTNQVTSYNIRFLGSFSKYSVCDWAVPIREPFLQHAKKNIPNWSSCCYYHYYYHYYYYYYYYYYYFFINFLMLFIIVISSL